MKTNLLLLYILFLVSSCTPKITTSLINKEKPLSKFSAVAVYDTNDTLPLATEKLGVTRIYDNMSTAEFDYNSVVELAKREASKAGGNAIKIIKHHVPNLLISSHYVYADILRVDTIAEKQKISLKAKDSYVKIPYSHWRLALNGGYAYNLGKEALTSDSRIQSYNNQMRSFLNFGAELNYFFVSGQMGIGINYESLSSQNSLNGVTHLNDGQIFSNNYLSDNLTIQYIGPMYTTINRLIRKNGVKDALIISVGMGNLSYSDSKKVDSNNLKISGVTLGTYYAIGYDRFISRNMALGIQLSYIGGLLSEYDRFDGTSTTHIQLDKNSYQSLGHLSLTVGLRFTTSK